MKKRICALLLCATICAALCACTDHPTSGADSGKKGSAPADAYGAFLAGEGVVYADRLAGENALSEHLYEEDGFEANKEYSLVTLLETAQARQIADYGGTVELVSAEAAKIDCGHDGVEELAIRAVFACDTMGDIIKEYIIKDCDGKLQICCVNRSAYRSEASLANPYGLIAFYGSISALSHESGYAYVNAEGEYVFLYSCQTSYAPGAIGGRLHKVIAQHVDDIPSDDRYVEAYNFSDPAEFDFENQTVEEYYDALTYSAYPAEDALVAQLFDEARVALHTQSDMEQMILADAEAKGVSREVLENRDSVVWEPIENDTLGERIAYGTDPVFVDTTDAFIRAIADGANIVLAPGTYNVTQYLMENRGVQNDLVPSVLSGGDYAEPELIVHGVSDLHITSRRGGEMAQIVCEPRYAQVITLRSCENVCIENVVMGHTVEQGGCSGDVIFLQQCENVRIKGCDLYGCGAYAINATDCGSVSVESSVIRDCSYGCAEMYNTNYIIFRGCTFRDCREQCMFFVCDTSADFIDCTFRDMQGDMLYMNESGYAYFGNCLFDVNALSSLQSYDGDGQLYLY